MSISNTDTCTTISEIAERIWRINTPIAIAGGTAFSFNQYLVEADRSLLFHTGPRHLFRVVCEAVMQVMSPSRLHYVGFCHMEADECGALNDWLACAPDAVPLCSRVGAMTSIGDFADRAPYAMADGEVLDLGGRAVQWIDAPMCPTGGTTAFCSRALPARSFVVTCSLNPETELKPLLKPIFSGQVRFSARRWITTPIAVEPRQRSP